MSQAFLSRAVTWALLPFIVVIGPVAVLASFEIMLPPGIMDGDDDDGMISNLSHLDLKLIPLAPSTLPNLFLRVSSAELLQIDEPILWISCVAPPTRSPPLV